MATKGGVALCDNLLLAERLDQRRRHAGAVCERHLSEVTRQGCYLGPRWLVVLVVLLCLVVLVAM